MTFAEFRLDSIELQKECENKYVTGDFSCLEGMCLKFNSTITCRRTAIFKPQLRSNCAATNIGLLRCSNLCSVTACNRVFYCFLLGQTSDRSGPIVPRYRLGCRRFTFLKFPNTVNLMKPHF